MRQWQTAHNHINTAFSDYYMKVEHILFLDNVVWLYVDF